MRRSKELKIDAVRALAELQEKERLQKVAEAEEREILDGAQLQVDQLCEQYGLYCGAIISPDDISSIVKLMVEKQDNVTIKAKFFFNE